MARMFLVDGSNHAFRVQFALPPRHTSSGFPTRVLYGFTILFQKMLRTWKPDYVVVSFDTGSNFREGLFPDYKGHRPETPEDLKQQWPFLTDIVEGFGFCAISMDGFEADDVLGTLATRFAGPDMEVLLVTGDKDFAQLVSPHIQILDDAKGVVLGEAEVLERFGVSPEHMVDYLALMGDKSDNVPGVPGIGKVTAAKLVAEYGGIDAVLEAARAGQIKGKAAANLLAFEDQLRLSYRLVTIATDAPVHVELTDLAPQPIDESKMRTLFERWEFGAVAQKMLPEQHKMTLEGWKEVEGEAALAAMDEVKTRGVCTVAVAGEPDPEHPWATSPTAVAFGDAVGERGVLVRLTDPALRTRAFALLADPSLSKVMVGHKRAIHALSVHGRGLAGVTSDVRLLDYVLTPHRRQHGLEELSARTLGHVLGRAAAASDLPKDLAVIAEEAMLCGLLHEKLEPKLDDDLRAVYTQLELPLTPVLARMEAHGISLDTGHIHAIEAELQARLEALEVECHTLAGRPFHVRSRNDVAQILFEELKLPAGKKLKTGYSTASPVLEGLVELHELPQRILDYRSLDKLLGTYLVTLPTYVAPDGRVHTTFQQAVTATGRLSSADPNLQNIPVRTVEGRRIRECFVAAPGCVLLSADYSQIELRVLAHFTQDETLIAGFRAGEDIHRRTAVEIFGADPEHVSLAQRSAAKAINFGLVYGMSAFRLARDLRVSRAEAEAWMARYFERMPRVLDWIEQTKALAREQGLVTTLYGRRRLIPEIHSKDFNERSTAEREAVNTRVQGTAADLVKRAMLRVQAALDASGSASKLLLQVHDELLLEVPQFELASVTEIVRTQMQAEEGLAIPLLVSTSSGRNWYDAHG